ncbi:cold-shock protein [Idiomarina sp.]|uniref:cold-shock protein n=1 Tax=Idiomarina sp. TaxID=1874361 RepID=UPI003A939E3A
MKKALVKNLFPEKGFGFVTDHEGNDAFFHIKVVGKNTFSELKKDLMVNVDIQLEERGPCVTRLVVPVSNFSDKFFVAPKNFIKTKNESPKYGTVFYRRMIQTYFYRDPDEAEAHARAEVQLTGGNALLNTRLVQKKFYEGNYIYRAFSMIGESALVMNGTKNDTQGIPEKEVLKQVAAIEERINEVLPPYSGTLSRKCNVVYDGNVLKKDFEGENSIWVWASLALLVFVLGVTIVS